jgi:septal ring factor EnvC (AmiA/AmiB activator)
MSDIIDKITKLEKKNNDNKLELAKLEERKNSLEEEKKKLLAELKETGVEEKELADKITDMEIELDTAITELEQEIK